MNHKYVALALVSTAVAFSAAPAVRAEDVTEIFKRVDGYVAQKNFPKALDELTWARKEIEKLNSQQLATYFPDSLAGYTGGKLNSTNAMGMMNTTREYVKGEDRVELSLSGTGSAGGLGGLGALGKMAAMMGAQNGEDTMRISGRTATLSTEGSPSLSLFLDSGGVLELKSETASVKPEDLKTIAEAIKIEDLDKYLRGQ